MSDRPVAKIEDRRAQFALTLTCGHLVAGAGGAHSKKCPECGGLMRRVASSGEMIRPQLKGEPRTHFRRLSGGLVVMHVEWPDSNHEEYLWWCKLCSPAKRLAVTMADVLTDWEAHTKGAVHAKRATTKALIDRVADAMVGRGS